MLAQFAHFALAAGRLWLSAATPGSRARAQAWFREGWDDPFGDRELHTLSAALRGVAQA